LLLFTIGGGIEFEPTGGEAYLLPLRLDPVGPVTLIANKRLLSEKTKTRLKNIIPFFLEKKQKIKYIYLEKDQTQQPLHRRDQAQHCY
jgi:hypothetical protein